jgi:hypothetical protein
MNNDFRGNRAIFIKGDGVNLPQFNGHAEKGYHGLTGVFDEQKKVPTIYARI